MLDFSEPEVVAAKSANESVVRPSIDAAQRVDTAKEPLASRAAEVPEVVEDWTWTVKLFTAGSDWNSRDGDTANDGY